MNEHDPIYASEAPATPVEPAPAAPEAEPVHARPAWLGEWAEIALTPIAGDDPAGEKLADQADYEALEAEIRKPQAMKPEPVDWQRVDELGRGLLRRTSKDIKVAGFVSVALVERTGLRGHAAAAALFDDLARSFGAALWPRRKRARAGALEWVGERLVAAVESVQPRPNDSEVLSFAAATAKSAHAEMSKAFAEDALEELRVFAKWAAALEAKGRAAERASERPERAAAPAAAPAGGGLDLASITDAASARSAAGKARKVLEKAAAVLLAADVADAAAYRLRRVAAWPDKLAFEVPADGATQIPMLEAAAAEALLQKLQSERDEGVLARSEAVFDERPLWIDVQRIQAQTMEAFGPRFDAARGAVVGATLDLLARFPALLGAKFANGVPFVGPATRAWIEGLGGGGGAAAAAFAKGDAEGAADDDPADEVDRIARAAAARGDLRSAVAAYQAGLARHADARTRFRLRLGLAQTCVGQGQPTIALPHLVELRADLARVTLGDWAPSLAADVLAATVAALRAESKRAKSRPDLAERAAEALGELSRLDPLRALELGEG